LLAQKNPESYLPEVAQMLNNLGLIHSAQDRMAEARKEYEEGLKTYVSWRRNTLRAICLR
jgi:Tetratricopeptide repeat